MNQAPISTKQIAILGIALLIVIGIFVFIRMNKPSQEVNPQTSNGPQVSDKDAGPIVSTRKNSYGEYLTDGSGKTLYVSTEDCTGECLKKWLPYLGNSNTNLKSEESLLKRINLVKLDDGYQFAYGTNKLYYYAGDAKAGDTNGVVVDPKWSLVIVK